MGESVHTAFRKGTNTGAKSMEIHRLIRELPHEEWKGVVEWIAYCLAESVDIDVLNGEPKKE